VRKGILTQKEDEKIQQEHPAVLEQAQSPIKLAPGSRN
jgi:hypothetical protein